MKNNRINTFLTVLILLLVCNQISGKKQNLYNVGSLTNLNTTDSKNKRDLESIDEHLLFLGIPMTDFESFSASLIEKGFNCTKPKGQAEVYDDLYDSAFGGQYLNRNAIVIPLIGKEDNIVGDIFVFITYETIQKANEDMNALIRRIKNEYNHFSIEESKEEDIYYIAIRGKNDNELIGYIDLCIKDLDGYGCIFVSLSDRINSHINHFVSETLEILE